MHGQNSAQTSAVPCSTRSLRRKRNDLCQLCRNEESLVNTNGGMGASRAKRGRDVTDELRALVRRELPEVDLIKNADLRTKVIEAWALALAKSTYNSIREIPPEGAPGSMVLIRGDQTD